MDPWRLQGFNQFIGDVLGRGQIGIAHSEINDIFTGRARLGLDRIDLGEDIRRQALYAVKLLIHHTLDDWFKKAERRHL